MNNFLLALSVYLFLFILLYVGVKIGYRIGMWRHANTTDNQFGVVKVAEGTVFALLGLLVAFSFSGAYDRFENRKMKIIEEINAIEMVYHLTDLLKPTAQEKIRSAIKHYVDAQIIIYKELSEFRGFTIELEHSKEIQNAIWLSVMEAIKLTDNYAATLLFIPAVSNMLEVANSRILITRVHPPIPIFILLIGLGGLSSFLAGYGMAKNKKYNKLYTLCFVAITAFTLYIIIDLEFPRIGMIRIDRFDHFLPEARDGLK